jgi:U3 small nucleolar ribonucleoprotein protein LCP5
MTAGEMAETLGEFCRVVDSMSSSIRAARETIRTLLERFTSSSDYLIPSYKLSRRRAEELNEKDGISLLSTKNFVMISYIHAVTLLSTQRVLGRSLDSRSLPNQSFGDRDREVRGHECGDLVDSLSEGRVILDKVKALELRMRYQIEKLMRLAEEPEAAPKFVEGNIESLATFNDLTYL